MLPIQFQGKHWVQILSSLGEQTVLLVGFIPVKNLIKHIYFQGSHWEATMGYRRDQAPAPTCLQEWGNPFKPALGMLDCPSQIGWVTAGCLWCSNLILNLEGKEADQRKI